MKKTTVPSDVKLTSSVTPKNPKALAVRTGVKSGFRNSGGDYDFTDRR